MVNVDTRVAPHTKKLVVFYDGWCPLCREVAGRTHKLDWFNRVEFVSFRDEETANLYHVTGRDMEKRIYSLAMPENQAYEGIYTILQTALRVPAYWIFAPFIAASIAFGFGQNVYDWIAARRSIIPVGNCTEESCQLPKNKGGQ
jgi:predicted DCC family thiol-disulfide oxidoreductase YuxK